MSNPSEPTDVVLIGGGIMSATLGALIKILQPDWSIRIFEKLGSVALESSNPWNNAGTGHAALCELNYMPEAPDGSVETSKAVAINEQFQVSRQLWSYLVEQGVLKSPDSFINPTPHMTFVKGEANVAYLRKRYEALLSEPLFEGIEYSDDPSVIYGWSPLLLRDRSKNEKIAATRVVSGTDVDFGSLTAQLFDYLKAEGVSTETNCTVTNLKKTRDGTWEVSLKHSVGNTPMKVNARFVFVGAGGGALHLLQKARIPEIRGFGGFPISGQFLRTDNPRVVAEHQAKVYGKAAVGAPPMSVPHLDKRVVDGQASLLFGPYAGFSPKFLKSGSWLDLPRSIRAHNLGPMLAVARDNLDLMKYLIGEVFASKSKKFEALREFMPTADPKDWYLITAGQRVQVMKKDAKRGGVLQFGTEVITSADGSIAGLLGASPGASTAVPIMLDLLERCFGDSYPGWKTQLKKMIPSLGTLLTKSPSNAEKTLKETAKVLELG
ncbi:malate:quinone oxidoreductase [Subtercola boreus]|uniref:Probable malate:quinone oxidoreductase n=1 Tax=Subtercola boreus TaxID=120213 RepID=A0A3E0VEJ0_9MICO|nr:malate:quinone oxidoreductase [Subtercola boreus]RFA08344.1 malate:quinone oxidoreductase [Subtercola boreus]TQL54753.1 malate dehydrogenase (quinone) [Subtercola boreus]